MRDVACYKSRLFTPKHWRIVKHSPSVTMANFCRDIQPRGVRGRISWGKGEIGSDFIKFPGWVYMTFSHLS